MKPLFIIIKKKYFDAIECGEKKEEYRLITKRWVKLLVGRKYQTIIFQNGYRKASTKIEVEYLGYEKKIIIHEFFGNKETAVFAIKIGKIISKGGLNVTP